MADNYKVSYKKSEETFNTDYRFSAEDNTIAIENAVQQMTRYENGDVELKSLTNLTTGEIILESIKL
jgi:hypothetical protein